MNNGKICVSVSAETADDFIKKINRAAKIADVIELRLDRLDSENLNKLLDSLPNVKNDFNQDFLATLHTTNVSKGNCGTAIKYGMLPSVLSQIAKTNAFDLIDIDYEFVIENLVDVSITEKIWSNCNKDQVIGSFHDFNETPLTSTLRKFSHLLLKKCAIAKFAVQASEITDSLSVWKLLEKAKSDNKQLIPIAMGEAGKWTRILGLAFGSPLTYASLESGDETAPGQISAMDLKEVYRVKDLDEQTEIYGIIGNPVSHSLSPYIHNAAFKHHNLNAVYIPFEVGELDEFIRRMVRPETREIDWNLKGFSVTIPHKEAIIKHLDSIDEDAKQIGAVNTVKIINGELYGYNTDAHGFIEPLRNSYGDLKSANVGIIGNGGAARACIYALKKDDANVTIFARNIEKAKLLSDELNVGSQDISTLDSGLRTLDLIVNTTPLGTIGELENESPVTTEQIKNIHLAYDLVYNPFETLFMRQAKSVDVPTIGGLAMLVAQGMKQFEIWTELKAPMQIMSQAALQRLK